MAETATSTAHINTASALPTLPQLVGDAEAAHILSQGVFVIGEDPITCPRCGRRTDWVDLADDQQFHTCVACLYRFLAEECAECVDERGQPQHTCPDCGRQFNDNDDQDGD